MPTRPTDLAEGLTVAHDAYKGGKGPQALSTLAIGSPESLWVQLASFNPGQFNNVLDDAARMFHGQTSPS